MTAVDTNVVVRLFSDDDARQSAVARALFAAGPVWIAKTVLLETEWVLRTLYNFDPETIRRSFVALLGLENVQVEDEASVVDALALLEQSLDFADALHLSSRPVDAEFATFDKALVKRAHRAGAARVRGL